MHVSLKNCLCRWISRSTARSRYFWMILQQPGWANDSPYSSMGISHDDGQLPQKSSRCMPILPNPVKPNTTIQSIYRQINTTFDVREISDAGRLRKSLSTINLQLAATPSIGMQLTSAALRCPPAYSFYSLMANEEIQTRKMTSPDELLPFITQCITLAAREFSAVFLHKNVNTPTSKITGQFDQPSSPIATLVLFAPKWLTCWDYKIQNRRYLRWNRYCWKFCWWFKVRDNWWIAGRRHSLKIIWKSTWRSMACLWC